MSNRETWKKDFKAYVESLSLSRDDYKGIMEYIDEFPDDHNADSNKMADGDCISRQAVVKFFNDWISCLDENCHHQSVADMTIIKNDFKNLPSAQPEQVCVATVTLTDDQVKGVVEKAKNAVISVIEPELHWIPCSEGLPDNYDYQLLTEEVHYTTGKIVRCVLIAYYDDEDDVWMSAEESPEAISYPIAWMPLPEPYNGGDSE